MPEIHVFCAEVRTLAQKHGLMRDLTTAMVNNFGVPPELVTVQIIESPLDHKAKGGVPFSQRPGPTPKASG